MLTHSRCSKIFPKTISEIEYVKAIVNDVEGLATTLRQNIVLLIIFIFLCFVFQWVIEQYIEV